MIDDISLTRLLNTEHLSLVNKIESTIKKHLASLPELAMLHGRLEVLAATEARALATIQKSLFTQKKLAADNLRDNAARQLLHYVWSFEYSDNIQQAAAARRLHELLKNLSYIVSEANERETVDLDNLVARLGEEPFASAIELIDALWLVENMSAKNAAFNTVSEQQTAADSVKETGSMNTIRKQIDKLIRQIFGVIETRFYLETAGEAINTCVGELNYDIAEAHTSMKQRLSRNHSNNSDSASENSTPASAD